MFTILLSYVVRPQARAIVVVDSTHFSSAEISSARRTSQYPIQEPCVAHGHRTRCVREFDDDKAYRGNKLNYCEVHLPVANKSKRGISSILCCVTIVGSIYYHHLFISLFFFLIERD